MVISKNIDSDFLFQTVLSTGTSTDQNFIIGCCYFLKKPKLLGQTKTLLFVAGIFLAIFLFPCDTVVMSLSYLLSRDGLIFLFFILWGLRFVVVS